MQKEGNIYIYSTDISTRNKAPISFLKGVMDTKIHYTCTLEESFEYWEDHDNPRLIEQTKRFRRMKANCRSEYKKQRVFKCLAAMMGKGHNRKKLEVYVPCLVFDIDGLNQTAYLAMLLICQECPFIYYAAPSLGGGLRIWIWADCTPVTHKKYYQAISKYLSQFFQIPTREDLTPQDNQCIHIDNYTSAINQLWYVCHTPADMVYHNEYSQLFELGACSEKEGYPRPVKTTGGGGKYKVEFSQRDKVENLIEQIELRRIDLTRGITRVWFPKVLLPLAYEFGEAGRDLAHRVSRFHPEYKERETDREFSRALSKDKGKVTIGTFYYICKNQGIYVDNQSLKMKYTLN